MDWLAWEFGLQQFDGQIRECESTTEQRVSLRLAVWVERVGLAFRVDHLTAVQTTHAGATLTTTTAVGNQNVGGMRRVQNRLRRIDGKTFTAREDGYLV